MRAMGVCVSSKTTNYILNTNINGDESDWGYSMAFCKAIHKPPAARPELDAMNRVMARKIAASVNGIKGKRPMLLFDFIKREIAMATTSQSIDLKIHSKIPFTQRVSGKDEPDNTETECNEMQWAIVPEI